jgi:hypothetical protein
MVSGAQVGPRQIAASGARAASGVRRWCVPATSQDSSGPRASTALRKSDPQRSGRSRIPALPPARRSSGGNKARRAHLGPRATSPAHAEIASEYVAVSVGWRLDAVEC